MSKIIFILTIGLSVFAQANVAEIGALGQSGQHSCIVSLSNGILNEFKVMQTCNSSEAPILLAKIKKEKATEQQVLLQIVKEMREKGYELVQSNAAVAGKNKDVIHYTFSLKSE